MAITIDLKLTTTPKETKQWALFLLQKVKSGFSVWKWKPFRFKSSYRRMLNNTPYIY